MRFITEENRFARRTMVGSIPNAPEAYPRMNTP